MGVKTYTNIAAIVNKKYHTVYSPYLVKKHLSASYYNDMTTTDNDN